MLADDIAVRKKFEKSRSKYDVNRTSLLSSEEKLRLLGFKPTSIAKGKIKSSLVYTAPLSGVVTAMQLQMGAYVDPNTQVVRIINTEHFHIELDIFESDAHKIKEGQKVTFTLPEREDEAYSGEIYLMVPEIDREDRTAHAHVHIRENDSLFIMPGTYVDASIFREE